MPLGITYNACTEGCGRVIFKDIITGSFNCTEPNGHLKILIEYVWKMMGVGLGWLP
jgi:hypothetical protein